MAEGKKSFVLYCDWWDWLECLTQEQKAKWVDWLFAYVRDLQPEMPKDQALMMVCKYTKSQLKEDLKKYENKVKSIENARKSNRNHIENKLNSNSNQLENNSVNDNVNVNVNVNDNVCVNTHNNIACEEAQISNLEGLIRELEQLYGRCLTNMEQAQIELLSKKYDSKFILSELKDNLDKTNPIAYISKKLQNKAKVEDDLEDNEWLKGFYERREQEERERK